MFPLQYEELVREYQRMDLLRQASEQRLVQQARASSVRRTVRQTALDVVCRLPLPVLAPACAAQRV
jgi:hypothetical protein